jgi:hypothetical protein
MKNRGFTVYELLISFAFLAIIGYSMLSMILSLKDKAYLTELEFDMKSFKNAISIKMENDFTENKIEGIIACGSYCINITYSNGITKEFSINKSSSYIKYGTEKYSLPTDTYFGDDTKISIKSVDNVETDKNDSFLLIDIPIEHYDVKGDFGIHLMYQYDKEKYDFSDIVYFNPITYLNRVYDFTYTGSYQTFTAPVDGTYKVELWGAQGGSANATYVGGKGGYSAGTIHLKNKDVLYVYVGQKGGLPVDAAAYNGGGKAITSENNNGSAGGGGGATDIRLSSGTWNDGTGLKNRIMVAAGGGGGAGYWGKSGGSGGGGSSYIGGVTNGQTITGNESMPNPRGTGNITGNSGNGYARITVIAVD